MIFGLQYVFLQAGFSAFNYWLGNYMALYTDASSSQLGLFFIIHPLTYVAKPLVCALADRRHSHKLIYCCCLFGLSLAYIPYVLLAYYFGSDRVITLNQLDSYSNGLDGQTKFWILASLHAFGATCFNSARALADALTVNYARRVNTDYGRYRRFGVISFGTVGFLTGFVNTNWIFPDYVLGIIILIMCNFTLAVIVLIWPDEYFEIMSESQIIDKQYIQDRKLELPGTCESLKRAGSKLVSCYCCIDTNRHNRTGLDVVMLETKVKHLSIKKQLRIFLFLLRKDSRIAIYLSLMILCGLTGYSGQHFIQLELKQACDPHIATSSECNSSAISGLIMAGICINELIILGLHKIFRFKCMAKVQLGLFFSAIQYLCIYFMTTFSPYFYVIASLHGAEAFIILLLCVEDGRMFANEVEQHLDEIKSQEIIDKDDDLNVIKVSLAATMIATLVLFYEGLGASIGRLTLGFLIERYGFSIAWLLISILSSASFIIMIVGVKLHREMKPNQDYKESKIF